MYNVRVCGNLSCLSAESFGFVWLVMSVYHLT
ncbi:hypothetical protein DFA_05506 [Cavenderia fasciculata]|uniref:Uncharacterized protein n=1 Tax=Cavenderia fasciculata TaxID=261658 RepID=F4PLF2_CACFS|nr:uncharacterized protein DFA_05506 [Cavenderia fasciculata]EGG23374.1 hypothetical protein DFA_05506 [Cavenderia fasciculata]|eukprot:XP_004361225.1 hypothetical protein DFA_05506 [Cavenderia fasciculata]